VFPVLRRALAAVLLGLVLVLPWGSAWAEPGEEMAAGQAPAPSATTSQSTPSVGEGTQPSPSPTPVAEDESDPVPTPAATPTASPTPPVTPSPSGSASTWSAAEMVDVSFSASPATIDVGESSTVTVTLTNPSSEDVASAQVMAEIPDQLELSSVAPAGTRSGSVLSVSLGALPAGATETVSIVVTGRASGGDGQPIRFALTMDDLTLDHELYVQVSDPSPKALGLTQSSPLLVQVGDTATFGSTLINRTSAPLEDIAVVARVAPELALVGVVQTPAADAIQIGSSPRGEDIVWIFETIDPGESIDLSWSGRVSSPGDLEASNRIEALTDGRRLTQSSQNTYLGYVQGVRTEVGQRPQPVVEERVVTKLVPVSTEVAPAAGGILPITGWSPAGVIVLGLGLMAAGGLLLLPGGVPRPSRLILIAILLLGTACVSEQNSAAPDDRPEVDASATPAPEPEPSGGGGGGPDKTDDKKGDRVLGLRLDRNDDPVAGDEPTTDVPVDPPADAVVYETVTEVVSVRVQPEVTEERLASRQGDNTMSFTWGPGSGLQAASSVRFSPGATEELLVGLSSKGDRLSAPISLVNLSENRRLLVQGRLTLEVSSGGRTSSLSSGPIDVVLEPGGQTTAVIAFSLPPGTYSAKAAFLSD
jgi:hypothetical protein